MKKSELVATFILASLIVFGWLILHLQPQQVIEYVSPAMEAIGVALVITLGMFFEKDKQYADAIKEYDKIRCMYIDVVSQGYEIKWSDYKKIYELNSDMEELKQEYYSNVYRKDNDHFKDFEFLPSPNGLTLEEFREEIKKMSSQTS